MPNSRTRHLVAREYDEAYEHFLREVLDGFHGADSFMGQIPPVDTEHCGPTIYPQSQMEDGSQLQQELTAFQFTAATELDVRESDFDKHTRVFV